jgi:YVTN family beta-propeller protein
MLKKYPVLLLSLILVFVSCDDNGNNPDPLETASVYVTNEGNFSDSNGSVTSYNPNDGTTLKKAFEDANGRPFAGLIQSAHVADGQMYLASNLADKLEIVDVKDMNSVGTVELSAPPTAVEVVNNTAYVTTFDYQTQNDKILLVDLDTMQETNESIEIGSIPRDIVQVGDLLYVTINSGNTVEVINPQTNTVEQTIAVGEGPSQMLVDNEDRIWIACNGRVSYDESTEDVPGSVYVLNGQTGQVIDSVESVEITATPGYIYRLALNNEEATAYLLNEGVSTIDMNTMTLSDSKFTTRSFYSIGYFAAQERVYLGETNGYTQPGQALLYNLEGTAVDSFATGIAPNEFHFIQQ